MNEKLDVAVQVNSKSNQVAGLNVSEAALTHLKKQMAKHHQAAVGIRLSLSKTGCSGLSYVFDFVDVSNPADKTFEFDDIKIYVEKSSYPYLKGLYIDFVKEGLSHKFVYQNPNQTGQCGCGESFTIE